MAGTQTNNAPNVVITINGQSFEPKNHLVNLTVERCIGDVANNFTLEVFDETAQDVELLLMSSYPSSITIKYCNNPNGTYDEFTGSVFDYSTSWVGMSTMLSITGVMGTGSGMLSRIGKQTITWVRPAVNPTVDDLKKIGKTSYIDSNNQLQSIDTLSSLLYYDPVLKQDVSYSQSSQEVTETNKETGKKETVLKSYNCYPYMIIMDDIMEGWNESYSPTWKTNLRVRPSDVFKRVLYKLRQSSEFSGCTEGNIVQTAYIYLSSWNQEDVSMLDYVNDVLCANSISEDGKAGYQCIDTGHGFDFKPIDYNDYPSYDPISLEYGKKNATVISVSINVSGSVAMAGGAYDSNGNYTIVSGALDDLSGDQLTYQNLEGYTLNEYKDLTSDGKYVPNTGDSNKQPEVNLWYEYTPKVWTHSSASKEQLNISASAKWEKIRDSVYKREIKIWGKTGQSYAPR